MYIPAKVQEHHDVRWGIWYSAVAKHTIQTDYNIELNNVKILASESKEINLFYYESLLILKQKPNFNKMQTSVKINLFT